MKQPLEGAKQFSRLVACGRMRFVAEGGKQTTLAGLTSEAYQSLLREKKVARALRDVAGALGASLELDELLELVLGKLKDLLSSDRAILFLLDERKRELVSRSSAVGDDYPIRLPLGEGLLSQVVRTGRLARVPSFSDSDFEADWDEILEYSSRGAIAAPLKNNLSRTIGVLLVLNKEGSLAFTDEDGEILSVLAKQAAIAIDNSRLLVTLIRKNQQLQQAQEQLTRRVRDLELLFELERSTAHAHSHEELAKAVLENLARACNAGGALMVLEEDEHAEFIDYALSRPPRSPGQTTEPLATFTSGATPAGEGILAPVISSSAPIQLDSLDSPLSQEGLSEILSLIAEPLEGDEKPLGALALVNKRGGPFTAEDLGLLRLVSANVSTAVRLFNSKRVREREERLTSIGRLLSQVVHDLKSPLTVISGYVQLMEESGEPAERKQFAEEILKQFHALGAMQREVLAFARGETQVFARRVILDRLLSDVQKQMGSELAEMGVELKISAVPKLVAFIDSERITRALQNLIRNAAEAMAPLGGGQVSVRADVEGKTLTLRIADSGPGIPPAIAPRLFQSFVTAGKAEGTGLGLAIVKRIIEEHGGQVALVSVARGACFLIELPDAVLSVGAKERVQIGARSEALPKEKSEKKAKVVAAVKKPAKKPKVGKVAKKSETTARSGKSAKKPTKKAQSGKALKKSEKKVPKKASKGRASPGSQKKSANKAAAIPKKASKNATRKATSAKPAKKAPASRSGSLSSRRKSGR